MSLTEERKRDEEREREREREKEREKERERERCYSCIRRLADGAIISHNVAVKAVTHTLLYHLQAAVITIEILVRLR
jgi:hypothetical protein